MDSKFLQRLTLAAVLVGGLGLGLAQTATADTRPGVPRVRPAAARGFNLFAGSVGITLNVNRVYCGVNSRGNQCTDVTGSPVLGGSYWPKGSPDQYMFNGGLQMAGIIPGTRANFAWAGDTVGVFFFNGAAGSYESGTGLTNVFNSRNADDLANWPAAAYVRDPTLYDASLLGLQSISEQDSWVRYWDGNTNLVLGRPHPMGLLVDQRTLAWNFPSGNEDILYFIMRYINITSTRRSDYAGLSAYGYTASDIDDILVVAQDYKAAILAKFGVTIPDSGYWFTRVYAGPASDPDVGSGGGGNFSTANLPFKMDFAYIAAFMGATWQFPADIFVTPFAAAPGFVGTKFLKGAADAAGNQLPVSMFTNTTNGVPFPDRVNMASMWRLASNNLNPTDGSCNAPRNTPLCQLVQGATDTRMYLYSGPLDIRPGESQVLVTAHVYAAPVAAAIANDGYGHSLGDPLFDLKPGYPGTPAGYIDPLSRIDQNLVLGVPTVDSIRQIDRVTGWAFDALNPGTSAAALDGSTDSAANGVLDQYEIPVVPGSLLAKANVAQTIFDNRFLLPFAPESPVFYLIPSDGQVTVVWAPSPTEQTGHGDPFFAVASNTLSALYNPNYRENDVEGYRIWRGRTQSEMTVIAQFDYAGTAATDYLGEFSNSDYGDQCAPDIGITASCPSFPHRVELVGDVVQVPDKKHAQLISGTIMNLQADTAVTGGNSGYPALRDTGVPFVYVDNTPLNGFRYFYAVTTFDVNSVYSTGLGQTSKSSGRVSKSVTPRPSSTNVSIPSFTQSVLGKDSTPLNGTGAFTISATTGRFSGTPPATGLSQLAAAFAPLVPQLLPALDLTFMVDSIRGRHNASFDCQGLQNWQGICFQVFTTFTRGTTPQSYTSVVRYPIWATTYGTTAPAEQPADPASLGGFPVAADSAAVAAFGLPAGFATFNATVNGTLNESIRMSQLENVSGRRLLASVSPGGSRWFDGANETLDHPTVGIRVGHLTGVDSIFYPASHIDNDPATAGVQTYAPAFVDGGGNAVSTNMQCAGYFLAPMGHQADIRVTWGAAGAITSVEDLTYNVSVPFKQVPQASWGFFRDNNGNNMIDWRDVDRLEGVAQSNTGLTFCAGTDPGAGNRAVLYNTAVVAPVTMQGSNPAGTLAGFTSTGSGFGLYINGQAFIFQLTGGTLPASGTAWTLRTYAGIVTATTNPGTATPSGYRYTARPSSPIVPGLRVVFRVAENLHLVATTSADLDLVHTVPDPYYVTNQLELTANTKVLRFVNLPAQAIIRIYSVSGILVNVLTHNDMGGGGEQVWNLRNRNNQFVASGVYFYHLETPEGLTKIGRFTVVNYAQ